MNKIEELANIKCLRLNPRSLDSLNPFALKALILVILLLYSGCISSSITKPNDYLAVEEKIQLELFVMSQCPYAVEAEREIIAALNTIKNKAELKLYFIAHDAKEANEWIAQVMESMEEEHQSEKGSCRGMPEIDPEAKFYSLHGQKEVEEDMRQLIVMKYYPNKLLDYLLYRAENYDSDSWEEAAILAWIDVDHITRIIESDEGEHLFKKNINRAKDLKVDSSPTLFINGKRFSAKIMKNNILRMICRKSLPCEQCSNVPVCGNDDDCRGGSKVGICLNPDTMQARCQFRLPQKINLTVIGNDQQNDEVAVHKKWAKKLFPELIIEELSFASKKGKEVIERYNINILPTYIYSKDIEKALRFIRIKDALIKMEDAYILLPQYLGKAYYLNRQEKKGQLDLFVESLSEIDSYIQQEIIKHPLLGKLALKIHFVAEKEERIDKEDQAQMVMTMTADDNNHNVLQLLPLRPQITFRSTKGMEEIEENIRQLSIANREPEKYIPYLSCRLESILKGNHSKDWKTCVKEVDIKKDTLSSWQLNGMGVRLLLDDIALAKELNIKKTPVILINNNILLRNFNLNNVVELLSGEVPMPKPSSPLSSYH